MNLNEKGNDLIYSWFSTK